MSPILWYLEMVFLNFKNSNILEVLFPKKRLIFFNMVYFYKSFKPRLRNIIGEILK
jgi:hypothetical protein